MKKKGRTPSFFGLFILFRQNKCSRKIRPLTRWKRFCPSCWISFCRLVQFHKPFEILMPSSFHNLLLCYLSFECPYLLSLCLPVPRGSGGVAYSTCLLIHHQSARQPFFFLCCFFILLTLSFWFPPSTLPACTSWLRLSGSSCYILTRFSPVQQWLSSPCGYLASDKNVLPSSKFFFFFFKDCAEGRDVWHHVFAASVHQI